MAQSGKATKRKTGGDDEGDITTKTPRKQPFLAEYTTTWPELVKSKRGPESGACLPFACGTERPLQNTEKLRNFEEKY